MLILHSQELILFTEELKYIPIDTYHFLSFDVVLFSTAWPLTSVCLFSVDSIINVARNVTGNYDSKRQNKLIMTQDFEHFHTFLVRASAQTRERLIRATSYHQHRA